MGFKIIMFENKGIMLYLVIRLVIGVCYVGVFWIFVELSG